MTNAILARKTLGVWGVTNSKIHDAWRGMHRRCNLRASYADCFVHESWNHFDDFRLWMLQQDFQGKSLDKDILFVDNKIYSADTCVFVSPGLNSQFKVFKPGVYPLGVSLNCGKYMSLVRGSGEHVYLGRYATPYEAHRMWQVAKSEYFANYSLDNESPSIRSRLRIALDYRAQRIRDDLAHNRITLRV